MLFKKKDNKDVIVFINPKPTAGGTFYLEDKVNKVLDVWANICNELIDPVAQEKCCIKVRWTQDPHEFTKWDYNPATVASYCNQIFLSNEIDESCKINCDFSEIVINQTKDFMGISNNSELTNPKHFFFLLPVIGSFPFEKIENWLNFEAVMMHELGHYLGFGDQYMTDANGEWCWHYNSIMDKNDFDLANRTLSEEDKCMYAKLYCCPPEASSVPEFTSDVIDNDLIIKMYPNPTNINKINIEVNSSVDISKVIKYQIISINGTLSVEGLLNNNDFVKQINLKNLNSGTYFLNIHYKNRNFVKIFEKID